MATGLHRGLPPSENHKPYGLGPYADAATRAAGADVTGPDDVGQFARQDDLETLWQLTNHSPVTWKQIDGSTPGAHASTHENGGADELNVAGLSGTLADPQTPSSHAASHQHGGADEIATATPAANAIPKAGAGGTLAEGWIANASFTARGDIEIATQVEVDAGTDTGRAVTPATLANTSLAFTPVSHASSHEFGGADILAAAKLRESGGPTVLDILGIPDGQYVRRSGATLVGGNPSAAAWPYSKLHTVDPGGSAQHTTITAGLAAASAGEAVVVGLGTYNEQISLKDGVDIIGLGPVSLGGVDPNESKPLLTYTVTGPGYTVSCIGAIKARIYNMAIEALSSTGGISAIPIGINAPTGGTLELHHCSVRGVHSVNGNPAYGILTSATNSDYTIRLFNTRLDAYNGPSWTAYGLNVQWTDVDVDIVGGSNYINNVAINDTSRLNLNGGNLAVDNVFWPQSGVKVRYNGGTMTIGGTAVWADEEDNVDLEVNTKYYVALTSGANSFYRVWERELTADPSNLVDGVRWYRGDLEEFRGRRAGETRNFLMNKDGAQWPFDNVNGGMLYVDKTNASADYNTVTAALAYIGTQGGDWQLQIGPGDYTAEGALTIPANVSRLSIVGRNATHALRQWEDWNSDRDLVILDEINSVNNNTLQWLHVEDLEIYNWLDVSNTGGTSQVELYVQSCEIYGAYVSSIVTASFEACRFDTADLEVNSTENVIIAGNVFDGGLYLGHDNTNITTDTVADIFDTYFWSDVYLEKTVNLGTAPKVVANFRSGAQVRDNRNVRLESDRVEAHFWAGSDAGTINATGATDATARIVWSGGFIYDISAVAYGAADVVINEPNPEPGSFFVDPFKGNDKYDGSRKWPKQTIQGAHDAAPTESFIRLYPVTYNEQVSITKDKIHIIGEVNPHDDNYAFNSYPVIQFLNHTTPGATLSYDSGSGDHILENVQVWAANNAATSGIAVQAIAGPGAPEIGMKNVWAWAWSQGGQTLSSIYGVNATNCSFVVRGNCYFRASGTASGIRAGLAVFGGEVKVEQGYNRFFDVNISGGHLHLLGGMTYSDGISVSSPTEVKWGGGRMGWEGAIGAEFWTEDGSDQSFDADFLADGFTAGHFDVAELAFLQRTSDPTTLRDGKVWHNGSLDQFRGRRAGVTRNFLMEGDVGPPWSIIAEETVVTSTTSETPILVPGMTITPPAGTYFVSFSGICYNDNQNQETRLSVAVDGVEVAASERNVEGNITVPFHTQAKVTVNGAQAIQGYFHTSDASFSAYLTYRQLFIHEVA
jgi:hypothetical protein